MRARASQREGTLFVWAANTNGSRREQPPRSSALLSRAYDPEVGTKHRSGNKNGHQRSRNDRRMPDSPVLRHSIFGGSGLHVRAWAASSRCPETRSVPSPKSRPSRRGGPPHNGGIFFVRGTPPRLTGLECRAFNGHPTPRGGARPPGRPSGLSRLGTP